MADELTCRMLTGSVRYHLVTSALVCLIHWQHVGCTYRTGLGTYPTLWASSLQRNLSSQTLVPNR
jgi:hypothetical protein